MSKPFVHLHTHTEYCLDPAVRVCTTDLRWIPISDVVVGDQLVGFGEDLRPPDGERGNSRSKMEQTEVVGTTRVVRDCYRIVLADGGEIIASGEHAWVVNGVARGSQIKPGGDPYLRGGNSRRWLKTHELIGRVKPYLIRWARPWGPGPPNGLEREAAWLAGIFDGEGWLKDGILSVGQNPGPVMAEIRRALGALGYELTQSRIQSSKSECETFALRGYESTLRFIAQCRPIRFSDRSDEVWIGKRAGSRHTSRVRVEAVEHLGERETIALTTTTRTFVAEGFLSHNSTFDGCGLLKDFLRTAKDQGSPAIAFTEHGTVRGMTALHEEAGEVGIRPIYGCELYVCDDMHRKGLDEEARTELTKDLKGKREKNEAIYQEERRLGILERFHLTVLAMNDQGFRNLMRLTSLGWVQGFYKRPRVDLNAIEEHQEGLIVLSGCMSGSIGGGWLEGDEAGVLAKVDRLASIFGDRFYAEIMPHAIDGQAKVNQAVCTIARAMDLPLVATQDAHYVRPEDWKYQEALLCIHTHTTLRDPERFVFGTHEFYLRDRAQMDAAFRKHGYLTPSEATRALDRTLEIAERCTAQLHIDPFNVRLPEIEVPDGMSEADYLRDLCADGWGTRRMVDLIEAEARRRGTSETKLRKQYVDRLHYELRTLEERKVVRYFLIVWDLYRWARAKRIEVGPGRGSVGGSLVAFLLGIHDVDPIRFGLLFERFIAPGRVDMPDIDCDFEDARREEILSYLRTKYGEENTAFIGTNGRMMPKAAVKDVCRVLGIPIRDAQRVADALPAAQQGVPWEELMEEAFATSPVIKDFQRLYPQAIDYTRALVGQVKSLGQHAAGLVISPSPLIDLVPLELRKNTVVTAVDLYGVADLGLMKLDVLGLRNLSAMKRAREAIAERHDVEIDWLEIPLDDQKVLKRFTELDFVGIFQFDTGSSLRLCEGVEFTNFEDLSAIVAVNRPGPIDSGLADRWKARKRGEDWEANAALDRIASDTLGVIIYQEHVMRACVELAGWDMKRADALRKAIAKKFGAEEIEKEREGFVTGSVGRGHDREEMDALFSAFLAFGRYAFNKAHATAYATIAYRQMWLKTYYPSEFFWGLLDVEPDTEQIVRFVRAARRSDIEIRPPDVNESEPGGWRLRPDGAIVAALAPIKGVGPTALATLTETRPFVDFVDLAARANRRKCNRKVISSLLKAGALDRIVPNRRWLHERLEGVWGAVGKEGWEERLREMLELSKAEPDWTEAEARAIATEVNPLVSGGGDIEAFVDFVGRLQRRFLLLGSEALWAEKSGFVWGRLAEADGERLTIEDPDGRTARVWFAGEGVPMVGSICAGHIGIDSERRSLRAHFLIDLQELRRKMRAGEEMTALERSLSPRWHWPLRLGDRTDLGRLNGHQGELIVCGVVTHVREWPDKNGNEMAFFGVLGPHGFREGLCFSSLWPRYAGKLRPGALGRFRVTVDGPKTLLLESFKALRVVKRAEPNESDAWQG